jgi:hypothetical protein
MARISAVIYIYSIVQSLFISVTRWCIASSETQFEHYIPLKPILGCSVGKTPGIFITPGYVVASAAKMYTSSRLERGYRVIMETQLEGGWPRNSRTSCTTLHGRRFIRVLDPGYNMRGLEVADVWGCGGPCPPD